MSGTKDKPKMCEPVTGYGASKLANPKPKPPLSILSPERSSPKAIRTKLNLTQAAFAQLMGVSVRTVRDWERGRHAPSGPAKSLLRVAGRHPEILLGLTVEGVAGNQLLPFAGTFPQDDLARMCADIEEVSHDRIDNPTTGT